MLAVDVSLMFSHLDELERRLKELEDNKIEIGYFEQQGTHYSGFSYPDLMKYLSVGNPSMNLPPRPIFDVANFTFKIRNKQTKTDLQTYFKNISKKQPQIKAETILRNAAGRYATVLIPIFGNTSKLASNAAWTQTLKMQAGVTPTDNPLVFTGDLRDNVSYRINNGTIKPLQELK